MTITLTPLDSSHYSLLLKWVETPHVKKYWDSEITYTLDAIKDKYDF